MMFLLARLELKLHLAGSMYLYPDRGQTPKPLHEVCFVEDRHYRESPERKWQRERAVEMVAEGYHKLEVARQMGVSRATIARWVEKERAAA